MKFSPEMTEAIASLRLGPGAMKPETMKVLVEADALPPDRRLKLLQKESQAYYALSSDLPPGWKSDKAAEVAYDLERIVKKLMNPEKRASYNLYDSIVGLASIDGMAYDSQIDSALEEARKLAIEGFRIAPEGEAMRAAAVRDFIEDAQKLFQRGDKSRGFQKLKSVVSNAKTLSKLVRESGKTAAEASKPTVKAWMKKNVARYVDKTTGEVNMTELAEDAADAFGKKDIGGWLDDPDHWVWDASQEVATSYEKVRGKTATSPDQWEKGASLIEEGAKGEVNRIFQPRLDDLDTQLGRVQKAFVDAAKQLENHKRFGVGRTESPALLLRPLREMKELARLMRQLADRVDKTIDGALRDTGGRPSDL